MFAVIHGPLCIHAGSRQDIKRGVELSRHALRALRSGSMTLLHVVEKVSSSFTHAPCIETAVAALK